MVSERKNYNLISYSGWIKNEPLPEQINREFSLACNQYHQVAVPLLRLCLCRLERREPRQDCYNKDRSDRYAWLHTSGAYPLVSSNMAETSTIKMDDFPRNLHWNMGFSIATFDYRRVPEFRPQATSRSVTFLDTGNGQPRKSWYGNHAFAFALAFLAWVGQ